MGFHCTPEPALLDGLGEKDRRGNAHARSGRRCPGVRHGDARRGGRSSSGRSQAAGRPGWSDLTTSELWSRARLIHASSVRPADSGPAGPPQGRAACKPHRRAVAASDAPDRRRRSRCSSSHERSATFRGPSSWSGGGGQGKQMRSTTRSMFCAAAMLVALLSSPATAGGGFGGQHRRVTKASSRRRHVRPAPVDPGWRPPRTTGSTAPRPFGSRTAERVRGQGRQPRRVELRVEGLADRYNYRLVASNPSSMANRTVTARRQPLSLQIAPPPASVVWARRRRSSARSPAPATASAGSPGLFCPVFAVFAFLFSSGSPVAHIVFAVGVYRHVNGAVALITFISMAFYPSGRYFFPGGHVGNLTRSLEGGEGHPSSAICSWGRHKSSCPQSLVIQVLPPYRPEARSPRVIAAASRDMRDSRATGASSAPSPKKPPSWPGTTRGRPSRTWTGLARRQEQALRYTSAFERRRWRGLL